LAGKIINEIDVESGFYVSLQDRSALRNKGTLIENKWSFSPAKFVLLRKKILYLYKKRRSNVSKQTAFSIKIKLHKYGKI